MTIKVTPDQVDNARLLLALDKARGLRSADWIVRLANAKPPYPPDPPGNTTASQCGPAAG